MEEGLDKFLTEFIFNRDPESIQSSCDIKDYDEVVKIVSEKFKEGIKKQLEEDPSTEESSFLNFNDISEQYLYMVISNWRLILFRNKQSAIDITK